MSLRTITGTILDSQGNPVSGAGVSFAMRDRTYLLDPDYTYMQSGVHALTDSDGEFSVQLAAGLPILWNVVLPGNDSFVIAVPEGSATTIEALRAEFNGRAPERVPGDPPTVTDFTNMQHAHTSAATGGILPYQPAFNVRAYGAVGDGVTDDTDAILAAIAAAHASGSGTGAVVYFPPGNYLVSGSGSQIFFISESITLAGAGMGATTITIAAGVGGTVDLFRVKPTNGAILRGVNFYDMKLTTTSSAGRHLLVFDHTTSTRHIANATIQRVHFHAAAGNAFSMNNGTAASPVTTPAFFTSTFRDCQFNASLDFTAAADSLALRDCTISGDAGITVDLVSGAGLFAMSGCNFTGQRGLTFKAVHHLSLTDNYFEIFATPTLTNDAIIDLTGETAQLFHPVIHNNIITGLIAGVKGVRVGNARYADIDFNDSYTTSGVPFIEVTSSASDTRIGEGTRLYGAGSMLTDAGTRTVNKTAQALSVYQDANYTGSDVNTAQKIFNASTNGAMTLAGDTTYELDALIHIHTTGTTSHALFMGFAISGGLTLTSFDWSFWSPSTPPATEAAGTVVTFWASASSEQQVTGSVAAASHHTVMLKGTIRTNAGGILTPQYRWSAAPGVAGVTLRGSYLKLTPVGKGSITTIGTWT